MKSHEVPEGWELKKITDISEIISGSTRVLQFKNIGMVQSSGLLQMTLV